MNEQEFIDPVHYAIKTKGIFQIRKGPTVFYYVVFRKPYTGIFTTYDSLAASGQFVLRMEGTKQHPIRGEYPLDLKHAEGLTVETTKRCDIIVGSRPPQIYNKPQ